MSANKQTRNTNSRKPRSDFQRLSRRFMSGFLRSLFLIHKPARAGQAGFVLPTTVLLLLIVTLTVGAMSFRTASRTQSAFLAREQRVIDNVAAPAVDRAKSKLEYLFGRDTRMPGTNTPSSDTLATLMLNGTDSTLGITAIPTGDPYTLPDETRIDINNDGTLDNAWSFTFDLDADGTVDSAELIAYSVLMDDSVDPLAVDRISATGALNTATVPTATRNDDIKLEDTGVTATLAKARNLVTRNGPINTSNTVSTCGGSRAPAEGWLTVNTAALEKNFQITAFVSNGKNPGRANSALELQQVRLAQRGNTWGAWFKYDMEIHPGPDFNWNGAIHTDGNLLLTNNLRAHMISSHNSCLYTANSSDITMAEVESDQDTDDVIDITTTNSKDFQGQLVEGVLTYGQLGAATDPIIHIPTGLTSAPGVGTALTTANDSVQGANYNHLLDIAMDPVALFTENVSKHRGTGTWARATDWTTTNPFRTSGRIFNQEQEQPFLDDFSRADDRYGPRPNYAKYNWVKSTEDGTVNTTRTAIEYDKKIGEEIISTDPRADNLTNTTGGLDGYWERKAVIDGMRVVVGQRLELGDHLGWNFNPNGGTTDSLYPATSAVPNNKQKQRVTLRDNLAAVQGMVVYQYETVGGQYPLACVANTAHPGTLQTLRASRTFEIDSTTGKPKTNFLVGQGTNGWEFDFPTAFDTESEFGAALANNQPLGIALRNLAYFAGDPNGGSPSFTPRQNATVHPFPHQAMWGDFSILRRIFDERLDATAATTATANTLAIPAWYSTTTTMSARYDKLSPADKSSLHSASCTLGLLAYNIKSVEDEYAAIPDNGAAGLNALGVQLAQLMDGNTSNQEIGTNATTNICSGSLGSAGCPPVIYDPNYYAQFTPQQWINALQNSNGLGANLPTAIKRAESILQMQQIERDRTLGFMPANTLVGLPGTGVGYTAATGTFIFPGGSNPAGVFRVGCDPTGFATTGGNSAQARLGLAVAFCSTAQGPKYPSLHYLFPKTNHGQSGATPYVQPTGEEYINQSYLTDATNGVNRAVAYNVASLADIAFLPRASNPTSTTASNKWKLPVTVSAANPAGALNSESMDIKVITSTSNVNVGLSLLDKVMYNGREEMAVRVLDVDLGKLTHNFTNPITPNEYWISDKRQTGNGIFYAIREDAAREDSITRPRPATTTDWTNCDTLTELISAACRMRASATTGTTPADPPLSKRRDGSLVGISTKPVDFAPDPDRRPNGFRLNADFGTNNGDLSNLTATTLANNTYRKSGLTFVTDNAAYIKGTFNPHTSNGANTLEEFTQTLFNNAVAFGLPFYNNRTTSNLASFAANTVDRWRVAEVLADSVYLLSNNFVDGAVEEGFIRDRNAVSTDFQNAANANSLTSFHNQQRPLQNNVTAWGGDTDWLRVDGSYADGTIPIWVGRNGESRTNPAGTNQIITDATNDNHFVLPNQRNQDALVTAAVPERINATIISGLVPSRDDQGYGGLHNFPRFLEDWSGDLFIQGAFLQLNFSTAGTGPFDIDAWEPSDTPANGELINYYGPPNRRWGYDVGLQFAPPGPIAERFVSIGRPRSEHYRELPVEDPYVVNLRCSKIKNPSNPTGPLISRFPNNNASCLP